MKNEESKIGLVFVAFGEERGERERKERKHTKREEEGESESSMSCDRRREARPLVVINSSNFDGPLFHAIFANHSERSFRKYFYFMTRNHFGNYSNEIV